MKEEFSPTQLLLEALCPQLYTLLGKCSIRELS